MTLHASRQLLVRMLDAHDARLHESRLERALASLSQSRPNLLLFICLGNICRSPFAARLLSSRRPGLHVDSAGFIGPGRPPPEAAVEAARAIGLDHADHRSKLVTPQLLEEADVIFVFDRHNAKRLRSARSVRRARVLWLGDLDPVWAGKRAIADPWGKPVEEFERTFARIARCIDRVAAALERKASGSASP